MSYNRCIKKQRKEGEVGNKGHCSDYGSPPGKSLCSSPTLPNCNPAKAQPSHSKVRGGGALPLGGPGRATESLTAGGESSATACHDRPRQASDCKSSKPHSRVSRGPALCGKSPSGFKQRNQPKWSLTFATKGLGSVRSQWQPVQSLWQDLEAGTGCPAHTKA